MNSLNPRQIDVLDRLERKSELQPIFFRKAKGVHWFDALNERGYFNPNNNPAPVPAREEGYFNIPPWPVTEYLVSTSEELNNSENKEYADKFIKLIRDITVYARENAISNYRTWWQLSKVISNIPPNLIILEDIDLIDYWLDDPYESGLVAEQIGEKWLSELLEKSDEHCNQISLRLLEILFKVNFIDKKTGFHDKKKPVLRYKSYHGKKIAKKVARLCGLKLGLKAVELFQNFLISILNELDNDKWSSIWRPAIGEHEQNRGIHDADDILVETFRDSLLGFVDCDSEAASVYLLSLFTSEYQTLHRLSIFTVDQRFGVLKKIANSIIISEYFQDNFRHELWHFLNNRYSELISDQKTKIINIIEDIEVLDDGGSLKVEPTAYKRLIWLSAIKDFDEQHNKLYKKYINTAGIEPKHPDFSSYMSVGWVDHKSPIPLEYLLSLNVDELIETVNNYEDPGQFSEPGLEGLVKCFKDVVRAKANDFYQDLMKFLDSDLSFIHQILDTYQELWREKMEEILWTDAWPCLLVFCSELIKSELFWSEENAKERKHFVANRHWVVSVIGRLIEEGTKSDEHAFDKSLLPMAKQILLVLLERQDGESFKPDSDAVFIAINSPRGRCIEALINLTLRTCRLVKNETGDHSLAWSQYESVFDSELKRSERGEYEFSTLVANYLPNFLFMSREWVTSNFLNIFDQSDYQKWLCAMQGYSYVNTVYQNVYGYLKRNGDYLKALDDGNLDERVKEKVIQNILISYINDDEDFSDPESLISILLKRKDYVELRQLVWFVWTLRDKPDEKLREKVFKLWPKMVDIINLESKEGRKLASQLCHWTTFIDEINSSTESWLLQIAPYAEEDYNSRHLLEGLAKISERQPMEAQKIWIKMLNTYSYDYPDHAIKLILKNLINLSPEGERKAKEVVDAYLKHGIVRPRLWLSEIKGSDIPT